MKIAKKTTDHHEPVGGAAVRYIETSALLAAIVDDDASAKEAIRGEGQRVCSRLTFAEASRVIARDRATERLTVADARAALRRLRMFENRCNLLELSDGVFDRLGRPFPVEPVRTLDAIHLATAEILDEQPQLVTVVTRDRRVKANAIALGFMVE